MAMLFRGAVQPTSRKVQIAIALVTVVVLGGVTWAWAARRKGDAAPVLAGNAPPCAATAAVPERSAAGAVETKPAPAAAPKAASAPARGLRTAKPAPAPAPLADPAWFKPRSTRGPESIVRWTTPLGPGLELLESGKAPEALEWVKAQAARPESQAAELRAGCELLQARALLAAGARDEAQALFQRQKDAAVNPEAAADAALGLALCQAGGLLDAVPAGTLEGVAKLSSRAWGAGLAAYGCARRIEREQHTAADIRFAEAARAWYQYALFSNQLEAPQEWDCLSRLNGLIEQTVLHPKVECQAPKAAFQVVQSGDSFIRIARRANVPAGQLFRVNKLAPNALLVPNQRLKVLPGPVTVRVDRYRLTATLLIDGVFIKRYAVGIGPDTTTPVGTFSIRKKQINPDWYFNGKRIPFGQPENILGTRWLGFDAQENGGRGAGIGMHGTAAPESVPGRESHGCVRMLNAEVEELYDFVPLGATVEVN